LARRAVKPVYLPPDVAGACCGTPFSSKGFEKAHSIAANRAIERFWAWSDGGRLPIVVDTSPCTYGLLTCRADLAPANQEKFDRLRILDSIEFVCDQLLPALKIQQRADAVVLHPVCSVTKLNLTGKLQTIARACAETAVIPASAGCCGFAGDRGFLVPELTASATRLEAEEISGKQFDGYFSSSRMCEVGLTRATSQVYRSYLYLLERATR
jgi:D-lactate dehydrogenase